MSDLGFREIEQEDSLESEGAAGSPAAPHQKGEPADLNSMPKL